MHHSMEDIKNRFMPRVPDKQHVKMAAKYMLLAEHILEHCASGSREQALALDALEVSLSWAQRVAKPLEIERVHEDDGA